MKPIKAAIKAGGKLKKLGKAAKAKASALAKARKAKYLENAAEYKKMQKLYWTNKEAYKLAKAAKLAKAKAAAKAAKAAAAKKASEESAKKYKNKQWQSQASLLPLPEKYS